MHVDKPQVSVALKFQPAFGDGIRSRGGSLPCCLPVAARAEELEAHTNPSKQVCPEALCAPISFIVSLNQDYFLFQFLFKVTLPAPPPPEGQEGPRCCQRAQLSANFQVGVRPRAGQYCRAAPGSPQAPASAAAAGTSGTAWPLYALVGALVSFAAARTTKPWAILSTVGVLAGVLSCNITRRQPAHFVWVADVVLMVSMSCSCYGF